MTSTNFARRGTTGAGAGRRSTGPALFLACSLLVAVLLPAVPAAAQGDDKQDWNVWAWNSLNETIAVRPLDDPGNPYLGQYSEFDLWVIDNYDPAITPQIAEGWYMGQHDAEALNETQLEQRSGEVPPQIYSLLVSADGFLIPSAIGNRQESAEVRLRDVIEKYSPNTPQDFQIYARGQLSEDLDALYSSSFSMPTFAPLHSIPDWLVREPPVLCGFTPEGEVLVKGLLGLGQKEAEGAPALHYTTGNLRWYRYSMEGELLDSFMSTDFGGLPLFDAYWQGPPLIDQYPGGPGQPTLNFFGEVIFVMEPQESTDWRWHSQPGKVMAAYNYKGDELDINAPYKRDLMSASRAFSAAELTAIWKERRGGLTALVESPYEGLPNGPQRFKGPAPQRFVTAQRNTKEQARFQRRRSGISENVVMADIEDPANPYLGQYDWVDMWILENANRHEAGEQLVVNENFGQLYRQRELLVAEAKAAGMSPEEFFEKYETHPAIDYSAREFQQPAPDWRYISGFVDADGFMIPLREAARRQLLNGPTGIYTAEGTRVEHFSSASLFGGGRMSDEQYEQYMEMRRSYTADLKPAIPAWLAAAPPLIAVLGQDGEWITIGEPGAYSEGSNIDALLARWREGERMMQRYSSEGELLESRAVMTDNWMELYAPELVAGIERRYGDPQHYKITRWYGYLAVQEIERQPLPADIQAAHPTALGMESGGRLIELYDYQGNALPLDTPLRMGSGIGFQIYGHEIQSSFAAQQKLAGVK